MSRHAVLGPLLALLLLSSGPAQPAVAATLPADVPINPEAGRGGPP